MKKQVEYGHIEIYGGLATLKWKREDTVCVYDIVECIINMYVMEFLGMCPLENVKECAELFSACMCEAAKDLGLPISCDVAVSKCWYGEEIGLDG